MWFSTFKCAIMHADNANIVNGIKIHKLQNKDNWIDDKIIPEMLPTMKINVIQMKYYIIKIIILQLLHWRLYIRDIIMDFITCIIVHILCKINVYYGSEWFTAFNLTTTLIHYKHVSVLLHYILSIQTNFPVFPVIFRPLFTNEIYPTLNQSRAARSIA